MANPFFSGRVPQSLYERAEEFIKQSGKTKTEVLIEALAAYLNHPIEIKKPIGNEEIWNAIKELQEKVATLEKTIVIRTDNKITDNEVQAYNDIAIEAVAQVLIGEKFNMDLEHEKNSKQIISTVEVPNLPGLENMDKNKIMTKLRNTKKLKNPSTEIGPYKLTFYKKDLGDKGTLFWEYFKIR